MEGIGLNAATRVFGYAKTTILNWEKKLSGLQETLFLSKYRTKNVGSREKEKNWVEKD